MRRAITGIGADNVIELGRKAIKVEYKWGNTVYESIGIAFYTHYYYGNLVDFQNAFNLAKSLDCDVTGNLETYRVLVKERRTLEDYVEVKEGEE